MKGFLSFLRFFLSILISTAFIVGLYFILKQTGIIGKFQNVQELKTIILSSGFFSYFVYFLLQFLQVTILPLPAVVTTVVGVIIFGPFKAFLISTLSIILGSMFAYFLGKVFGRRLLDFAVGKEKALKFENLFKKGKWIFFVMMMLPLFPDDILCLVAGTTKMDFKFFMITNIVSRVVGVFCTCFLSNLAL